MNFFKSLKERKATTCFFIISFTIGMLIFSLGSSAIVSEQNRNKEYNPENNKGISFENYIGVTFNEVKEVIDEENISAEIRYADYERTLGIETRILSKGKELKLDMKSGKCFTPDELKNNENNGIYSSRLDDEIEVTSFDKKIKNKINKVASYYDIQRIVIIPNQLFENLYGNEDMINLSTILQGDPDEIQRVINKLEEKFKDKKDEDSKEGMEVVKIELNLSGEEGKVLYNASILIFVITIINSISISSLWVKGRKKEIVLRKVMGANDKDIAKIFFGELVIIALISLILATIIQQILVMITGGFISNIDMRINIKTLLFSFGIAIITAFSVSIPSLMYISKVQPAEMLKEE